MTVYALLRRLLRLALTGHGRCACLVVLDHPEVMDIHDHALGHVHHTDGRDNFVVLVGQIADVTSTPTDGG